MRPLVTTACLTLLAAAPTTRPHTVIGDLRTLTLDSVPLGRPVTLRVWLPPGYEADPAARYDVLYLHDGQNCFDAATSFAGEWQVDETLTKLIAEKKIPPLIAVGVDNGGAARLAEYTFDADPTHGGGRGDRYAEFLLDEAMPRINHDFRTNTGPAHTLLAGSSLGGLATLDIARRHAGVFGGLIVMSPSLWWNNQALTAAVEHDPAGLAATTIWLDMGTAEEPGDEGRANVTRARRLDAALTRHGVPHRLTIAEGAGHNEAAWAERFGEAVSFLLSR